MANRYPTHYESVPHTNCRDPKHCDCACPACLTAKGFRRIEPPEQEWVSP